MRAKSILLLMVALGCGMVAAVAVSKTLMERDTSAQGEDSVEILVALKEFKTAAQVTADKVKLEKWPKSKIPEGAVTDLSAVDGKFARQGIFPGEPILAAKLADSNSSLSTQIPAGHTLFNIPFNNNYIKPGDIVDISGVFKCCKTKKTEVLTVLKEIQVFAINGVSDRDVEQKGGKDTVFQLLIKQDQTQALMLASNMGKLELNLRPLGGDGELKGRSDNGESFMAWAREYGEETVEAAEPPVLVTTPTTPAVIEPKVEAKPNEILIVTPEGVTRYHYSGSELPQMVKPEDTTAKAPAYPTNPFGSYSGFGGYTPTYPNASGFAPNAETSSSQQSPAQSAGDSQQESRPDRSSMLD